MVNGRAIIGSLRRMPQIQTKSTCLAIVALLLWLGGFGCALCCATGVSKSCPLDDGITSGCCKETCCTSAETEPLPDSDAISQLPAPTGCSLLPDQSRSLALLTKVGDDLSDGVPSFSAPLAIINDRCLAPTVDPPLPLNRGDTYLRCCVLLI